MAEPEFELKFPGSKTREISSPIVLRLKKKTFFFCLFVCPKPCICLQTLVLPTGSKAVKSVYWGWGCSKGHIDSGGLPRNPLVVTFSVVDMPTRPSASGCSRKLKRERWLISGPRESHKSESWKFGLIPSWFRWLAQDSPLKDIITWYPRTQCRTGLAAAWKLMGTRRCRQARESKHWRLIRFWN